MATINRKGEEREEVCTACGRTFIARGHAKYCSDKCRAKARRSRRSETVTTRGWDQLGSYRGCIGCTDFALDAKTCDYLLNNGHCRPCKINEGGGCAVKSRRNRIGCTRNSMRTWSVQDAARLLAEGKTVDEVAQELNANRNSVKEWLIWGDTDKAVRKSIPEPPPEKRHRGRPRKFSDEQFRSAYEQGLTDRQMAE